VKLRRFNAIVDAYGGWPEHWPEQERAAALELSRSSLIAARALADARTLDRTLQSSAARRPTDPTHMAALRARIMAAAKPIADSWFGRWFGFDITRSQLWQSAAGLAFATVLGFGVGLGGLLHAGSDHDSVELRSMAALDLPAAGQ
jgi:hypothetical protein